MVAKTKRYAVIMAGGVGVRLWPHSRKNLPKQFHDLMERGTSLLQDAYQLVLRHVEPSCVFVVTNTDHASLVAKQLPSLDPSRILAEPSRRNTAPCIAYASYRLLSLLQKEGHKDASVIITPADHYISKVESYDEAMNTALQTIEEKADALVTLGVRPTRPETSYGYIQYDPDATSPAKPVRVFTEKPEASLAKKFYESGEFLWNAGIFVWKIQTILNSLQRYAPEISEVFSEGSTAYGSKEEPTFLEKAYQIVPTISIDYAVIEKHAHVYVVPCQFTWSDLGSWEALYAALAKEKEENVVLGDHNPLVYEAKGNLLLTKKKKIMLVDGLENYLVADFDDVLLICPRNRSDAFRRYFRDAQNR